MCKPTPIHTLEPQGEQGMRPGLYRVDREGVVNLICPRCGMFWYLHPATVGTQPNGLSDILSHRSSDHVGLNQRTNWCGITLQFEIKKQEDPLEQKDCKIGSWYVVTGRGPCKLVRFYDRPNPLGTYNAEVQDGFTGYMISVCPADILHPLTLEQLESYQSSAKPRGIVMFMYNEIKKDLKKE